MTSIPPSFRPGRTESARPATPVPGGESGTARPSQTRRSSRRDAAGPLAELRGIRGPGLGRPPSRAGLRAPRQAPATALWPALLFAALWTRAESSRPARTPVPLSAAEAAVLERLRQSRPARPQNCILFSDPNKDPDDAVSFVIGKPLQDMGLAKIHHVVTTLGPADIRKERARFAKGVFDALGMPEVAVSAGREYDIGRRSADHGVFLRRGESLCVPEDRLGPEAGQDIGGSLARLDGKATLVAIAGMTDANALLQQHPDLVKEKVERIVIMGGIEQAPDAEGWVQPDERAYNNHTDQAAARAFYRTAQEYGIPLRIVSKEAAYQAAVPPELYEALGQTGHPVGSYLMDIQRDALRHLWRSIMEGQIARLDKRWFYDTFVARPGQDAPAFEAWRASAEASFDAVWESISRLNLYDPLTLLAAADGPAGMLFRPATVETRGTGGVELIGAGQVAAPADARNLMSALAKTALGS
ncbi:type III secretion system effector XopQ [Paracidovorax citrulli]|uniref:Inosine/uridine-preferring nucleoside hydrolase n=2 Tax=Paracidovorax citrulli TaxID=80869 RepID=A1TT88_PARC0|nr:type III secretion system effector XopQ [Paracidovorax citrulli]ABM34176.1 Inosine/uridine-preferring nucleoside hydrolase [Paracidovorax citrulli AAC00-1]ATG93678.1 type III secretion system effector protein [Paracidovorax citrulli]PVY63620.1 inosine-uridine preferring nucleoside hydrolase [Paracidovorax citrulli]REG67415.1 inosine-uridine preferring nucleoside hydrolase [Paracidovorax citrulli]RLJ91975.1 inosine-uridine preferring nucleoside hydrolase [Paracidovorax citrulli]